MSQADLTDEELAVFDLLTKPEPNSPRCRNSKSNAWRDTC
jgi:hypothetical protein